MFSVMLQPLVSGEIAPLCDRFVNLVRRLACSFFRQSEKKTLSVCESFCTFVFADIKLSDLSLKDMVLERGCAAEGMEVL